MCCNVSSIVFIYGGCPGVNSVTHYSFNHSIIVDSKVRLIEKSLCLQVVEDRSFTWSWLVCFMPLKLPEHVCFVYYTKAEILVMLMEGNTPSTCMCGLLLQSKIIHVAYLPCDCVNGLTNC